MNRLEQELRPRFGERLQTAAPLADLTSFRIGGPADVLLAVESEDELRAAQRLILNLNPRPGAAFAEVETRSVVPDVIVRKVRIFWRARLNPAALPKLRINRLYAELAGGRSGGRWRSRCCRRRSRRRRPRRSA